MDILKTADTTFYIGNDLFSLGIDTQGKRMAVVTTQELLSLLPVSLSHEPILIPDRPIKTQENLNALLHQLFTKGYDRNTVLVAFGGGSVTDLVGFCASIFLRGVPLILIPTTLLAMVDASIGGKNSIDTPYGKNLMGTFYHPQTIYIDFSLLDTLPKTEWNHGMAEVLKLGLVYDETLFSHDFSVLKAIQGKLAVSSLDFKERGLRRILNFGHTIGHAIEMACEYTVPHGQAVAIGCMAESWLSFKLGYLPSFTFDTISNMYDTFSLRLPALYSVQKAYQALFSDKKRKGSRVRSVLIDRIGHAIPFDEEYCAPIEELLLVEALSFVEKRYG